MSYCRWSSDDFQCDLYCYEAVGGGYVTHVASMRHVLKELPPPIRFEDDPKAVGGHVLKELPPPIRFEDDPDGWMARHALVMRIVENSELVPIGLPCDGECYEDKTLKEFRDRIAGLIAMGYRAPSKMLETIDAELKENGGVK